MLLADNDSRAADVLRSLLSLEVVWVRSGHEVIAVSRRTRFDLLLIDLALPDRSGLDVVRTLQAECVGTPFILMSNQPKVPIVVEAMTLGALNVLEKPIAEDAVCKAVRLAMASVPQGRLPRVAGRVPGTCESRARPVVSAVTPRTVAERWANFVLTAAGSDYDLKTVQAWSKFVGVSRSALCEYCRLVHVTPRDARDFARMLRAVSCCDEWHPEAVLDFGDARTLDKMLARAGLTNWQESAPPTIADFLLRQSWIARNNPGLLAVQALLI